MALSYFAKAIASQNRSRLPSSTATMRPRLRTTSPLVDEAQGLHVAPAITNHDTSHGAESEALHSLDKNPPHQTGLSTSTREPSPVNQQREENIPDYKNLNTNRDVPPIDSALTSTTVAEHTTFNKIQNSPTTSSRVNPSDPNDIEINSPVSSNSDSDVLFKALAAAQKWVNAEEPASSAASTTQLRESTTASTGIKHPTKSTIENSAQGSTTPATTSNRAMHQLVAQKLASRKPSMPAPPTVEIGNIEIEVIGPTLQKQSPKKQHRSAAPQRNTFAKRANTPFGSRQR